MQIKNKGKLTDYLSSKYVFIGLIVLSIAILTAINNYYFYAHVARENDRNAEKIRIIVNEKLALCSDNNIAISDCTKNIVSTVDKVSKYYYYVTEASMEDSNGNIIWKKTRNRHDKVAALRVKIKLPDLIKSKEAKIDIQNHWSNANIALSVYRSMTFSATQLIGIWKEDGVKKAFKFFTTVAWYRSRPAIGFAIFTIILFLLYRKREAALDEKMRENERNIVESEKNRLIREYENTTLQEKIEDLKSKENGVSQKIQDHDSVINPPLNTFKYDKFLELDPESIIFKCRKVAEKLVIQIYNKSFKTEERISLYNRIERLSKEKIIDSKIVGYINTIKAFGNLSAHPNIHNPIEFNKEDALMVSHALILLIEELENRNLLVT